MNQIKHSTIGVRWDAEYCSGRWRYLAELAEAARFGVIAAQALTLGESGRLLDVGCGEGLLLRHLPPTWRYVGVDISHEALAMIKGVADRVATCWAAAGTLDKVFVDTFDVVVFGEVLYYVDDPGAVVMDGFNRLRTGGRLVVSMYQSPDNHSTHVLVQNCWSKLDDLRLDEIDRTRIENLTTKRCWEIRTYAKTET